MIENADLWQEVARLNRIVRGENGYYKGLAERVPLLEGAIERLEAAIDELVRIEKNRSEREALERKERLKREEKEEDNRKWWKRAAVGAAIAVVSNSIINWGQTIVAWIN